MFPDRVTLDERAKYEEIHAFPEYGANSPGMINVERFMRVVPEEERGHSLLDIGCGTGLAGLAFTEYGFSVSWWDITDAALDARVPRERFTLGPVWRGHVKWKFDWGYSCDLLEHLPPQFTMLAVDNILRSCHRAWLQIHFIHDNSGRLIGRPLHLTVQPFNWWRDSLAEVCVIDECRDLCGEGLFIVRRR